MNNKYIKRATNAEEVKENLKMVYDILGIRKPWVDENEKKKDE